MTENMATEQTMNEMQQRVDNYIGQFEEGYFPPLELLARLTEELGELSREVQHTYGTKKKKPQEAHGRMADELGDMLFTIICFANREGLQLDQLLHQVMQKVEHRDNNRWTRKDEVE